MPETLLDKLRLARGLGTASHLVAFALASSSIGSLLAYFSGIASMATAVKLLLLPSTVLLVVLAIWARRNKRDDLLRRLGIGLWAGSFATLAYDIVRVPLAHSGAPVFKAISYFGTVILGQTHPTLASEAVGWAYHFSNGIGFAIMYMLLVRRPGLISAAVWGVSLELAMLITPYAEIFGYPKTTTFFAITIGSHLVYGVALWLAARTVWGKTAPHRWVLLAAAWLLGPLVLCGIALDFHNLHARTIPVSPPAYIGPHLYVAWNVPEPDRIASIWLTQRFLEPEARFHFIAPMSNANFGKPFDMPEAELRRTHNLSSFEVLLSDSEHQDDPGMAAISRLCHETEIRPWGLSAHPEEMRLAEDLRSRLDGCEDLTNCLDAGLAWMDEFYSRSREAVD